MNALAECYVDLAKKYYDQDEYEEAIKNYLECGKILNDELSDNLSDYNLYELDVVLHESAYVSYELTWCLYMIGDYDMALSNIDLAIETYPQNDEADEAYYDTEYTTTLASCYAIRGHINKELANYDEALSDYNEAKVLRGDVFDYYRNVAGVYKDKGDYQEAIKFYTKHIKLDNIIKPHYDYSSLIDCFCEERDFANAKKYYEEARRKYEANIPQDEYDKTIGKFSFLDEYKNSFDDVSVSDNLKVNTESSDKSIDDLLDELNALTGLWGVKEDVNSLINLLRVNKIREQRGMKKVPTSMHLVFSGNPGTGKTTVARILAQIYKELGILSSGQLVEVDRSQLVAGYVGQTALQTQRKIQEAIGGVLFIDEAYTLSSGKGDNDYGQEAIDTILKAMEDNRENLVVIVAGYPELMQEFLDSNPGLRSRFNKFINFEDYTAEELTEIFEGMCCKAGYSIEDGTKDYVLNYMKQNYSQRDEKFANAREVRNVFERAVTNQANRLALDMNITDDELMTLVENDIA